jgi:hypothetical protein
MCFGFAENEYTFCRTWAFLSENGWKLQFESVVVHIYTIRAWNSAKFNGPELQISVAGVSFITSS